MNYNFNPDIGKNTQFSSTNQPEKQGRKKKIFSWLKSKYELDQSDLENIINYISMLSKKEFEELAGKIKNNKGDYGDTPMIVVKIMQAYAKANVDDIIKLMRATGKATEKHEVTGKDGSDLFDAFKKNLMGE